ncbi:hypothetical protein SAMN05444422_10635 [Halobiforma haloterrestris]|uniref:Short C-terminal domain-containing protein n=1 Tax=Natronobacterium haloterrestre TaxID=148448 RepID=A0A1I1HTU4_NATHA|nr:SHOCT domain-containing protein [Halobiforma haloterrestris]SFC24410.1 hypothetical protein SAMN05444422_10635 [Halobiforma haloterrestris]
MGERRFDRSDRLGRWHALVEHYTPDGWLGRSLLGSTVGTAGLWLLALALFEVPRWGVSLGALFWLPAFLGLGLPALALSLTVLWPVYLSLIGNVESADAYSRGTKIHERTASNVGTDPDAPPASVTNADAAATNDPFVDLKRRYESGELSEAEFERRIESRLEDETKRSAADAPEDGHRERLSERE